jgi:DNA polymerase-1
MRLNFDIEADNLLRGVTQVWMLIAEDVDTGARYEYLKGDTGWKELFDNATEVSGHNIINYDLAVLKKLYGYVLPKSVKIVDTLLYSQILDYKRFGERGHSLKIWGEAFGFPKQPFEDFTQFSEEMLGYCRNDVDLGVKVYKRLMEEYAISHELTKKYLENEHYAARWVSMGNMHGWPFDKEAAQKLFDGLHAKKVDIETQLEQVMGLRSVIVDKTVGAEEAVPKSPKFKKDGGYDHHTCRWFGIESFMGLMEEWELPVSGEYCRVEFRPLKLSSTDDVKVFLFRHGWVPSEFNWVRDKHTGELRQTSPKIVEEDLAMLGPEGKLYLDYLTIVSRYGILRTWLAEVDDKGMLHGDCMLVGTPSMRSRHSIIVNVPSADSVYGADMRKLFGCLPGWKLIGCDSAGNQARGLAHYLGNAEFTELILHGDIHTYNAEKLTEVLREMYKTSPVTRKTIDAKALEYRRNFSKTITTLPSIIEKETNEESRKELEKKLKGAVADLERLDTTGFFVMRSSAKRILYAFLFGASGGKLWSYVFDYINVQLGKKMRDGFLAAVPGFKDLEDKLKRYYKKTVDINGEGRGYIPSGAKNKIYVDSTHKLLVYLLQALEKITCTAALRYTMDTLEAEGIPYIPCIFYHDEIDFMVPEEFAERAMQIGVDGFRDGPKTFNVQIMDGGGKIGKDWYDVH